ncbi:MAG TPA: hypothetical protein DD706_17280 [Nitrospiraceae bacterium]|nr:hypothetical protein [Nitrospiraceae bacterium]
MICGMSAWISGSGCLAKAVSHGNGRAWFTFKRSFFQAGSRDDKVVSIVQEISPENIGVLIKEEFRE